jgi:hypothetical protein
MIIAVLLACGLAVMGLKAQSDQKPVVRTIQNVYEPGHIRSMGELWQRATAVVDVEIIAMESRDKEVSPGPPGRTGPPPLPRVMTAFTAKVRTIYKLGPKSPEAAIGQTIAIERQGGSRDRGSYIEEVVDEHYPLFKVGERYVLFLTDSAPTYSYFGVISADGVFQVVNDRVVPIGAGAFVKGWRDQPLSEFNATLARFVR